MLNDTYQPNIDFTNIPPIQQRLPEKQEPTDYSVIGGQNPEAETAVSS